MFIDDPDYAAAIRCSPRRSPSSTPNSFTRSLRRRARSTLLLDRRRHRRYRHGVIYAKLRELLAA